MEAAAIAQRLQLRAHPSLALAWSSECVQVVVVGIRAVRLAEVVGWVREFEPAGTIIAGVGGGLAPQLKVGDVVVDGRLHKELPGVHLGRIHTAEKIVATPEEKAELFARTGALTVDMETGLIQPHLGAFWSKKACEMNPNVVNLELIPTILAVRAISDAADMTLDARMLTLVDAMGRPRMGKVLGMLLRRPAMIGELLSLRRQTNAALQGLVEVVEKLTTNPEIWLEC